MPRLRVLGQRPLSGWLAIAVILLFILTCWTVFFTLYQPFVAENGAFRIGNDSAQYLETAAFIRQHGIPSVALITLEGNLLGPVLIALLIPSVLWIAVFDFVLFFTALRIANGIPGVNGLIFGALLAFNAETLSALITLNKEILALFSITLLARYIYSKKRSYILLAIILTVSLMTRWEQFAIVLLFVFLYRFKRPKLSIFAVVAGITFAYPAALHFLGSNVSSSILEYGASGQTIAILNRLQGAYAFPIVVAPKVAMELFGRLLTPSYFISGIDWSQEFMVEMNCVAMLVLFLFAIMTKRFRLDDPIPFLITLYLIATAVSTFIQPRYEYPVYVLLCIELARNPNGASRNYAMGTAAPSVKQLKF